MLINSLKVVGALVFGGYISFLLLIFLFQEKLVFQPGPPDHDFYKQLQPFSLQYKTNDNTLLQGWRIKGRENNKKALLYFGGNAQDVSSMLSTLDRVDVSYIYTFNYRGYGSSQGNPSQKALYADALEIFDLVAKENYEEIIVLGYSMGSALAGYVATHRQPPKLILLCPLQSTDRIGRENFFVPSIIIKHNFDLAQNANKINSETLVLIAAKDQVIPPEHSEVTYSNIQTKKEKHILKSVGHNNIFSIPDTMNLINLFIVGGK